MPTVGVEFAKVSYTLPVGRDGKAGRVLLREVSLRLEAGTTTALLGRSGSGKTTLLRMVNGLVTPTSGEVLVEGRRVSAANRNVADRIKLRRGIGYVIQETGLFPHMTVERNAGLSLEMEGRPREEVAKRAAQMLTLVGMDFAEFRERHPWQLSGGQRQRVGLARALALAPRVLLMDEPFGALDPMTRAEMQTMVKALLERVGKTVLLVTHDLDEALYLAARVVFLADGEVVADLAPHEVPRSDNLHVKAYVRALNHSVAI
jgi:osmoprotectant transport system ATP-binding protein